MTNKSKDSTCRVFSYFKKNPGVLIAAGSAVITLATFIFNSVSYLMDRKYLNTFGFNISQIGWEKGNLIYSIIWVLVWMMFSSLSFYYYFNSFKVFLNSSLKEAMDKAIIVHNLKETKKEYRELKKKKSKNQRTISSQKSAQLQEMKNKMRNWSSNLSFAKENLRKKRKENLRFLFPFLLFGLFVQSSLLFFGYLFNKTSKYSHSIFAELGLDILATVLVVFVGLLSYCFLSLGDFRLNTRNYCQKIHYREDLVDEYVKQCVPSDNYILVKWKFAKLTEIFCDKNIMSFIKTGISNLFVFLLIFVISSQYKTSINKTFSIYTEDSTSYAIVYQSNGCAYMDQVDIVDEKIVFYTSKHRTVPSNDIVYEDIRFKKVEMIGLSN